MLEFREKLAGFTKRYWNRWPVAIWSSFSALTTKARGLVGSNFRLKVLLPVVG